MVYQCSGNCPGHLPINPALDWASQFEAFIQGTSSCASNNTSTSNNNNILSTPERRAANPPFEPLIPPFVPKIKPKKFAKKRLEVAWDKKEKKRRQRWVDELKEAWDNKNSGRPSSHNANQSTPHNNNQHNNINDTSLPSSAAGSPSSTLSNIWTLILSPDRDMHQRTKEEME